MVCKNKFIICFCITSLLVPVSVFAEGAEMLFMAAAAAAARSVVPVISVTSSDTLVTISKASGGFGATSYDIHWGTASGIRTNTIAGVSLPFNFTGLTPGTTYYYSVVARNGGSSSESTEKSVSIYYADSFDTGLNGWTLTAMSNGVVSATAVWSTDIGYNGSSHSIELHNAPVGQFSFMEKTITTDTISVWVYKITSATLALSADCGLYSATTSSATGWTQLTLTVPYGTHTFTINPWTDNSQAVYIGKVTYK